MGQKGRIAGRASQRSASIVRGAGMRCGICSQERIEQARTDPLARGEIGRLVPVKSLFLGLFVGHFAATELRARIVALGGSIRADAEIHGRDRRTRSRAQAGRVEQPGQMTPRAT